MLEIGDKISLTTKDDTVIHSYVLHDTITYNGGLVESTKWEYSSNNGESYDNPSTIGESIKQTYARVDKVNKQIDLVVSDVKETSEQVSSIKLTTDSVSASVSNMNKEVENLKQQVSAKMTAEDVKILIESNTQDSVSTVQTTTGFTFDADGLTINKGGSEITTKITEDGMTVYRGAEEVLVADNSGVKAEDLHATTYLIVGKNSRFEDMGENRTACFWIGE